MNALRFLSLSRVVRPVRPLVVVLTRLTILRLLVISGVSWRSMKRSFGSCVTKLLIGSSLVFANLVICASVVVNLRSNAMYRSNSPGIFMSDGQVLETASFNNEPSMTRQADADAADINNIVRDFGVTGMVPQGIRVPSFEDFDAVFDFQTAMNAIRQAEESFMAMPASVRSRFGNDPQLFVEFCSDEANLPEMRKLGLAVPEPPAPVVAPADPSA